MRPYLFLLLPLSLAPVSALADTQRASMDAAIVRAHEFARLTAAEASRLVGKRARYRIVLDSSEWEHDGYVSFDCQSNDNVSRGVWLLAGDEVADEMEVEARLVIRHHRGWTAQNGAHFPAFTEYRLMDARHAGR